MTASLEGLSSTWFVSKFVWRLGSNLGRNPGFSRSFQANPKVVL
jgi:hypothetical protein